MAEYNRSSIINIRTQDFDVLGGIVTRENNRLNLSGNSACRFLMSYLFSKDFLKTNSLRVRYSIVNSDKTAVSRYNPNVKINLHIQYYMEDRENNTYVEGTYSTIQLYPYFNNETDGYISQADVIITNDLIKQIYIDIVNDSEEKIEVSDISIYKEQSTTDLIDEALSGYSFGDILKSIDVYEDGMVAYYQDDEYPVTIQVQSGDFEGTYKINVSDIYTFNLVVHSGQMPWARSGE